MFCKQTQNTIDTLLRLKDSSNDSNKIASTSTTRQEREDLTVVLLKKWFRKVRIKD